MRNMKHGPACYQGRLCRAFVAHDAAAVLSRDLQCTVYPEGGPVVMTAPRAPRAAPVNPFQGHMANWAGRTQAAAAPPDHAEPAGEPDRADMGVAAEATDMCAPGSCLVAI